MITPKLETSRKLCLPHSSYRTPASCVSLHSDYRSPVYCVDLLQTYRAPVSSASQTEVPELLQAASPRTQATDLRLLRMLTSKLENSRKLSPTLTLQNSCKWRLPTPWLQTSAMLQLVHPGYRNPVSCVFLLPG